MEPVTTSRSVVRQASETGTKTPARASSNAEAPPAYATFELAQLFAPLELSRPISPRFPAIFS
jgi:hypothetical protein